jgi:hypothetical protein
MRSLLLAKNPIGRQSVLFLQMGNIIALHHHVVEYPRAAKALSVGTALINGNWFVRQLKPLANRAILMHGHRHIDWIGRCANLLIVSAPSPCHGSNR